MDYYEESVRLHREKKGKLEVVTKMPVSNKTDLSLAYTPGVAEPCRRIASSEDEAYDLTIKGNFVAIVSDGSAVLGLGNIGGLASMPVMEGKAALFKSFANIDAIPIVLNSQDVETTIQTVRNIAPTFGGINLEDIKAPECFEIEARLQDLGIPVMHDDQHGTAVVVLSGLINALKVVGKKKEDLKVALVGVGAAGTAIAKLLLSWGVRSENMLLVDREGILYEGNPAIASSEHKQSLAKITNTNKVRGSLADALVGADVFIGVSAKNLVSKEMAESMNKDAIVFAMANPEPEIHPDVAKEAGVRIIASGRSDYPNQINNVLAFPGIFRGALDIRATRITESMKVAAAEAIAGMIENPSDERIIPAPFEDGVADTVAEAVKKAWLAETEKQN